MPHHQRIKRLQQILNEEHCQAILVDDKINLYYLTGLELSAGKLIVDTTQANLFVDSRYFELCKTTSPVPVTLVETATLDEALSREHYKDIKTLGFDASHTTVKEFQEIQKVGTRLVFNPMPIDDPVGRLRTIKDHTEITALTEAAALGSAGYDYVVSILREGITEEEIAQELEIFWKKRGSKTIAFDPIIAFGTHSSMPHYRAGKAALKKGDAVLIDIGVNYRHYHSDMTRVVFFGSADPKLEEIYTIVKDAQQRALDLCRPGVLIGDLDKAARQHIIEEGFGDFFTHGLGHGVGLEIHEAPWVRNKQPHSLVPLEAGMVITIEPGIYLPGIGGIRIEDSIAISKDGHINLTNRPKEITII